MAIDDIIEDTTEWSRSPRSVDTHVNQRPDMGAQMRQPQPHTAPAMSDWNGRASLGPRLGLGHTAPPMFWLELAQLVVLILILFAVM